MLLWSHFYTRDFLLRCSSKGLHIIDSSDGGFDHPMITNTSFALFSFRDRVFPPTPAHGEPSLFGGLDHRELVITNPTS